MEDFVKGIVLLLEKEVMDKEDARNAVAAYLQNNYSINAKVAPRGVYKNSNKKVLDPTMTVETLPDGSTVLKKKTKPHRGLV